MPTESQLNANRENAQHSTGPKTPEGNESHIGMAASTSDPRIHPYGLSKTSSLPGRA